jgi:hypothetical protein
LFLPSRCWELSSQCRRSLDRQLWWFKNTIGTIRIGIITITDIGIITEDTGSIGMARMFLSMSTSALSPK